MEEKDLDRLFRQKLESFEATPSSQAWQQLEQSLQHKKDRKGWYYFSGIAASLLLLMGIWGVLELNQPAPPVKAVAVQETDRQIPSGNSFSGSQEQTFIPVATAEAEEEISKGTSDRKRKEVEIPATVAKAEKQNPPKQSLNHASYAKAEEPASTRLPEPNPEPKTIEMAALTADVANVNVKVELAEQEEVIIHYTPVNNETVALAFSEKTESTEEKDLSARKVLGFFKKVSRNNTLADLRDAKDQLLSLDRFSSPE